MEVLGCIKRIVDAIDRKLGARTVDLASGVSLLSNRYTGAKGTTYISKSSGSSIQSCRRICDILDGANKVTGHDDSTLTDAVQRLCDGYEEGVPLYSFGAISDLHIQYETGLADFQRALTYLRSRVPFTCVCGDLVSFASAENMAQYKQYVDAYAGGMTLYECAGNHETYPSLDVGGTLDEALWRSTTGKEPFYSFTHGGDVFLFLSLSTERTFASGGLAWLESQLESNKGKRCFVFQHLHDPEDDAADPSRSYSGMLGSAEGQAFLAMMKRYKNAVWFHGHTHLTFSTERYPVSEKMGYRSVHVPSLQGPRFYDDATDSLMDYYYDDGSKVWGSLFAEGYIVDVYGDKIVLRGIDFAAGDKKNEVHELSGKAYVLNTTS